MTTNEPRGNLDGVIGARVSGPLLATVREIAEMSNVSVGEITRRALRDFIDKITAEGGDVDR